MRHLFEPLIRHPLAVLSLTLLWLLLQGSLAPAQILLGSILAWAITTASSRLWSGWRRPRRLSLQLLARYLWRVAVDVVIANLRIAALILTPSRQPRPAFVELPLALQEPFALYLLATTITLSPGSLSADLSDDRRVLLLHLLDAPDPAAAAAECAQIKARYERLLLEIFS
ncbi:MAG: Na+/H+ antiporter subunit E [Lamprobacter sp.]|uniref:Na+/H+ antiporter subunit E n=1 Tax=Lamprobacter sp. TaxID=3100796 RepID=UPI002B25C346|nr:Na+/H+ antiporter subunit E [Lamprobacter sp.]MEA3641214.1 Na+/H+ antiporter subunit E [Lamprobacter sp.]